ncbi:uncharacterized protein MELLADRAFT_66214 [Melampsora larici-populina 98AG31]|uniref:Myb/SANT-like domain-containing protein n=1 Tax=Melampsora larici-populina (strain 98AG31 / pathotype 3-4-7) TaxID=747676 RepID=F4RYA3_MELLP|nr:uncharacterized protein MELLADRAFT_66214 [Melampsora larici-populina 98AG31]EGG02672.1 hypothetical protein MELLADRAFT_66214 [Melampsora larici-populina 98AG31]
MLDQTHVYETRSGYLAELISKQRRKDQTLDGRLSSAGWTKVTTQFNEKYPGSFAKALLKDHFDCLEKKRSATRQGLQSAISGDFGDTSVLMSSAEMLSGVMNLDYGHPGDHGFSVPELSNSVPSTSLSTPTPTPKRKQSNIQSQSRKRYKEPKDDKPYSVRVRRNSNPEHELKLMLRYRHDLAI